ncbi:MAG: BREX-4 system phosphatase PglZ [Thermoguttaceae bacterium]|nr:BREX-4 system phosphatase PglZ [Thermoguttaceae bacterium]
MNKTDLIEAVKRYAVSKSGENPTTEIKYPFFAVSANRDYSSLRENIHEYGFKKVFVSDFCYGPDTIPDWDELIDCVKKNGAAGEKILVIGLSEYFAFQGEEFALRKLKELKDIRLGGGRAVLLFRSIGAWIKSLKSDPRFDGARYCDAADPKDSTRDMFSVIRVPLGEKLSNASFCDGFKAFLHEAEKGEPREYWVSSALTFEEAKFSVKTVSSAYEIIKHNLPHFVVPQTCGTEKEWKRLKEDLEVHSMDLLQVFRDYGFVVPLSPYLLGKHLEHSYEDWLFFLRLKFYNPPEDRYLKHVLEKTTVQDSLAESVLGGIQDYQHIDRDYWEIYHARKNYISVVPDSVLNTFIQQNRLDADEMFYRLTDETAAERREIISQISEKGLPKSDVLERIYPDLAGYLADESFSTVTKEGLSEELASYFKEYKEQKVLNRVKPEFIERVKRNAEVPRLYNYLKPRDGVVHEVCQKKPKAYLYWLDALGAEYISLIRAVAEEKGLIVDVEITRANLPTITSENKKFYDDWPVDAKRSDKTLDEIKHDSCSSFDYTKEKKPIHLESEIEAIKKTLENIKSLLSSGYDEVVLTGDHGSSRLAVLMNDQDKIEVPSKGEHSGRCCKATPDIDLTAIPFATKSDSEEWVVLADYSRFKGGRDADVEVHGGATFEEIVVPVITLRLKRAKDKIKLVNPEILLRYKETPELLLSASWSYKEITVEILSGPEGNGRRFTVSAESDGRQYRVHLGGVGKKGVYTANVFSGEEFLAEISFCIASKGMQVKKDDFF